MKKTTIAPSKSSRKSVVPELPVDVLPSGGTVTRGSGNVFADLGFANPDLELKKAQLASKIHEILKAKKLTQAKAGEKLGISQPQVSLLFRGILRGFTIDRLIRMLHDLGHDVRLSIVEHV
jgi:predicted XRE-type DNA-binding protein